MITSITIDGLRGIRHGEVAGLGGLSILVGPNGCGKSTVLDALLIGASAEPARAVWRVIKRRAELVVDQSPVFSPEWLTHRRTSVPIGIRIAGLEAFEVTTVEPVSGGFTIDSAAMGSSGSYPRQVVQTVRDYCRISVSSARSGAPDVTLIDPIEDATAPLHFVYSDAARRGRATFANDVLRELIPGFSRLEILTEPYPVLYMHIGDAPVPVSLSGEGVLALVRTVLELGAAADGGLALLEEPEVHQHPRSLRLMAQGICAAVKRGVQVVLTTHSLELIEALLFAAEGAKVVDQTSIHLIRLRGGELTATRVEGEAAKFQILEIGEDLR